MNPSLVARLTALGERLAVVAHELEQPETPRDTQRFAKLAREHSCLAPAVQTLSRYRRLDVERAEAEALTGNSDRKLARLAAAELNRIAKQQLALESTLLDALIPPDPDEGRDLFLEIRAGTGGDEAGLFAGDLLRMYSRYAETRGWRLEIVNLRESELGGIKEAVLRLAGADVYARLRFESGTHRVQRVPRTESQGRIHTSACTVAVLPEVQAMDQIEINSSDLRVDTYRASGAGGQHVNRTDSAVRITHRPSGLVVECQDERSQHQNRARAMALLSARLLAAERERQSREQSAERKAQVGSGDRSERIRTYNYPQGRVTDHRIGITLYQLDAVIAGALDLVIEPLIRAERERAIAALTADSPGG